MSELPADRVGLYEAILGRARHPDNSPLSADGLCKTAWSLWLAGERRLKAKEHLQPDEIKAFRDEGVDVLSSVGSDTFEFRHDQMRAYLAARWALDSPSSIPATLHLLGDDDRIWKLPKGDQEEVWHFLADMLLARSTASEDLQDIWRFASEDASRGLLQEAIQQVAMPRGFHFSTQRVRA